MIDTKRITNIHLKREEDYEKMNQENRETYTHLSFLKRKMFNRVNNLIFDITQTIKEDSGFIHTPGRFIGLSNFGYNGEEITFVENVIESDANGYHLSDNPTPSEIEFFSRYEETLKRLHVLEVKRKSMLIPPSPKVISIDSIVTKEQRIRKNKDINFYHSFINSQADEYIREYGSNGIFSLVRLLNLLSSTYGTEEMYNAIIKENIPHDFRQDLLKWGALYDIRSEMILDRLARERLQKYLYDTGVMPYEERMTDNLIKLT